MKQGASRHAFSFRKDDLNETPACAVHALLRCEKLPHEIWEPCAGRGAIARELIAAGHKVIAYDLVQYKGADSYIQTPIDFLMERKAPEGVGCIVTNPPYKIADEFIAHGLSLGCNVIALLRLMALEGVDGRVRGSGLRSELNDRHLVRVWIGRERLPMMHREGYEGPKIDVSGVPYAWFVFRSQKHLPGFPIATQRMSWRAAGAGVSRPARKKKTSDGSDIFSSLEI